MTKAFRGVPGAWNQSSSSTQVSLPLLRPAATVSSVTPSAFFQITRACLLAGQVIFRLVQGRGERRNLMYYLACAGPGCLAPVVLTNLFAGMIFSIQTGRELINYGATHALGGAFAMAYCRELCPILTAAILAGQVGSAFAAEIGCMKLSEQIDALKVLRTDPIDYLVVPRVLACCIMLPILMILSLFVGIGGGLLIAHQLFDISAYTFLSSIQESLMISDLVAVLLKAVLFGAVIAIMSCSHGLTTACHGKGVGQSTTAAVVTTWVGIFVMDFVVSILLLPPLH